MKRFHAATARMAMKMVKAQMGPDAVILSNTKTTNGVEIVAAIDFDEQGMLSTLKCNQPTKSTANTNKNITSPSASDNISTDNHTLNEMRSELHTIRKLIEKQTQQNNNQTNHKEVLMNSFIDHGYTYAIAQNIINFIDINSSIEEGLLQSQKIVSQQIPENKDSLFDEGGVVALVGPTGVGKTTTIAKLAAHFLKTNKQDQLGIVTIDNYRIAAHEQISTYGRILDIPVRIAIDSQDLTIILHEFRNKKLVLIDTAGFSHHDDKIIDNMRLLLEGAGRKLKKYLVLSAATDGRNLDDIVESYKVFKIDSLILTKLDEAARIGGSISVSISNNLPISFITNGQRVPEDLSRSSTNKLLSYNEGHFSQPISTNNNAINSPIIATSERKIAKHS